MPARTWCCLTWRIAIHRQPLGIAMMVTRGRLQAGVLGARKSCGSEVLAGPGGDCRRGFGGFASRKVESAHGCWWVTSRGSRRSARLHHRSARGVLALLGKSRLHPRAPLLSCGLDLAADAEVRRANRGDAVRARSYLVIAAFCRRKPQAERRRLYPRLDDDDGLRRRPRQRKRHRIFGAKSAIHPRGVPIIHQSSHRHRKSRLGRNTSPRRSPSRAAPRH